VGTSNFIELGFLGWELDLGITALGQVPVASVTDSDDDEILVSVTARNREVWHL
jgi:hypothetical protein